MARTPKPKTTPKLVERTPVIEWAAALLGLVLTLAVLGVTVWELLADPGGRPAFVIETQAATPSSGAWTVPITVRNTSFATAAEVEVEGVQTVEGQETAVAAIFPYVPARGRATGGMVFPHDPAAHPVTVSVKSYRDP